MPNTDNAINLLVKLGVDTKPSETNLNKQIAELAKDLEDLKIGVAFDDKSIKALKNLENIDLGKLRDDVDKLSAGFENLGKETAKGGKEASKAFKDVQRELDGIYDNVGGNVEKVVRQGVSDIEELKKAYEGMDARFYEVRDFVDEGDVKGQTQAVREFTAELKNLNGEMERLRYNNRSLIDMGKGEYKKALWLPEKESRVVDSTQRDREAGIKRLNDQMYKLRREGKLTEDQFSSLTKELNKIKTPTGVEDFNRKLDDTVHKNKEVSKALQERLKLEEEMRKLQNRIISQQAKDPTGFGANSQTNEMLNTLKQIDPASKGAAQSVKDVSDNFERMRAEATVAGRESMTVMDSFRVAMEKFPVWMAASTVFYGTVRSIKSVISEIISLDSQMTVLRRVGGDGVNVNKVLEESVELAKQLGNEIADVNEGFIAFARQGFRGDDLTRMAEYATLLGNISELNVEDAASVLTAGMKGFNIEAENSIRIVDALNEVDKLLSLMLVTA